MVMHESGFWIGQAYFSSQYKDVLDDEYETSLVNIKNGTLLSRVDKKGKLILVLETPGGIFYRTEGKNQNVRLMRIDEGQSVKASVLRDLKQALEPAKLESLKLKRLK